MQKQAQRNLEVLIKKEKISAIGAQLEYERNYRRDKAIRDQAEFASLIQENNNRKSDPRPLSYFDVNTTFGSKVPSVRSKSRNKENLSQMVSRQFENDSLLEPRIIQPVPMAIDNQAVRGEVELFSKSG